MSEQKTSQKRGGKVVYEDAIGVNIAAHRARNKSSALTELEEQELEAVEKAGRLGVGDFMIAATLATVVFLLQCLWSYPGIHPSLWNSAAVAAGIRPPTSIAPGYAVAISSLIYKYVGIAAGNVVLRMMGHAFLALSAFFVYLFMREVLSFVMRARPQHSPRRRLVMMIASLIGTAAFVASDPVWAAGQFFGENALLLALSVASIEFFFAFLRKGLLKYSYICSIILGFLIAESPAGLIFLLGFLSLNMIVIKVFPNLESPFFKPALIEVGKWHMTFILIFAFIIGVALNCMTFIMNDGLAPLAASVGDIPLKYLRDYVARMSGAATLAGWILLLGLSFGPFLVSMVRFSVAADEERFLLYSTGIVFLFCGAATFSQCASLPALWFWTYVSVGSNYLLSLCTLMCALTVACSVTILGVDSLCRDHRHLADRIYGIDTSSSGEEDRVMSPRLTEILRRLGIVIVPLVLLAALLPARVKRSTRAMLAVVQEAIEATVDEAKGAEYLFTDGNLDSAIELESRARGGALKCISLIGDGPHNVWLRTRGITNSEDKLSFSFDGAMGLRSWLCDKPESLSKAAVQIGFDLWKRSGRALPPIGGLMSRPCDTDERARTNAVNRARALANKAIAIYDAGIGDSTEDAVKSAFYNVEWRLGRMCFYRAEYEDLSGDPKAALFDMEIMNKLNTRNGTYQELLRENDKRREQMMRRLTPREGLQLALVRADFNLGKVYAEAILGADLENPDANFALAMYYYKEGQYSRAEEFLKRCLIRRPEEPAFYNNLAIIQIRLGKLDAAEINVARALEIVPESAEVRDTQKKLEKARQAAENK